MRPPQSGFVQVRHGARDAALGLGRVGGDLLNAEFLESPPQLSRRLFTGELFGQGPVGIVALEDAVAVAVEAERARRAR